MALQIPGYRVIRKINQGGMATVYLAIQISVGRIVALKVMNPLLNTDPAFSERFQSEATIVGQLSHPNIVSIYDIGQHQGLNYIAMDYLPNGSAHEKMMKGISGDEALRIIKQIASALDHAHEKGYIHRDIKPENILFRADEAAVLTDFGVAKGVGLSSRMTHAGTVVGTPHYMSPEQSKGLHVDGRADLYSLGIVFFELLTGTLPYQGDEAVTVALKHISAPIPKLPASYASYQKLLDKLLAKNPDDRFQRGRDLVAAIEELELAQRTPGTFVATEPTTVPGLFKQLLQMIGQSLYWRWRKLQRLRWSRDNGFYLKTATDLDEVFLVSEAQNLNRRHELKTQIHDDLLAEHRRRRGWIILGIASAVLLLLGIYFFSSSTSKPVNQTGASSSASAIILSSSSESSVFSSSANSAEASSSDTSNLMSNDISSEMSSDISSASFSSAESSSSSSIAKEYQLTVTRDPKQAKVRILNIRDPYQDGIALKPGEYHLEVSHADYETERRWVTINDSDLNVQFILKPAEQIPVQSDVKDVKTVKAVARTKPLMVRIPGGTFIMGSQKDSTSMPAHKVEVKSFKISQFETTFAEYDYFAKETGRSLPSDNRWGRDTRPVINVSWEDAKAYTQWLSKTTGKTYRLPTESEWEFAARAKTTSDFWWGNDVNDARDRANCRRGCNSKFSGLFGSKTAPVGTYPANPYELFDTSGNVAEWVEDCYAVDFQLHPKNGTAYQMKACGRRVVRGGSAKDNAERITNYSRDYYPPEMAQENVGFRVVEEL